VATLPSWLHHSLARHGTHAGSERACDVSSTRPRALMPHFDGHLLDQTPQRKMTTLHFSPTVTSPPAYYDNFFNYTPAEKPSAPGIIPPLRSIYTNHKKLYNYEEHPRQQRPCHVPHLRGTSASTYRHEHNRLRLRQPCSRDTVEPGGLLSLP
jgi:hypothetical protein